MKLPRKLLEKVLADELRPGQVLNEVRVYAPVSAQADLEHPWWKAIGVEFFDAIELFAAGRPGGKRTDRGTIFLSPREAVREAFRVEGKVVHEKLCGERVFRVLPVEKADEVIVANIVAEAMPAEMVEPAWDEFLPTIIQFRALAERQYLVRLLHKHRWNITAAAREAEVSRPTMHALLNRNGMERPSVFSDARSEDVEEDEDE